MRPERRLRDQAGQRSLRRKGSCGRQGATLIRASIANTPCGLAMTGLVSAGEWFANRDRPHLEQT